MTTIIFMTVPGRLDLSCVHEFRSERSLSDEIVSRPLHGPVQRRTLDDGEKGSFVLNPADTGSNELREYICTMNERRGDLPSSDLPIGDMFEYTNSSIFKYNSVSLSLDQNDPRGRPTLLLVRHRPSADPPWMKKFCAVGELEKAIPFFFVGLRLPVKTRSGGRAESCRQCWGSRHQGRDARGDGYPLRRQRRRDVLPVCGATRFYEMNGPLGWWSCTASDRRKQFLDDRRHFPSQRNPGVKDCLWSA
jgi:hypothetical protein